MDVSSAPQSLCGKARPVFMKLVLNIWLNHQDQKLVQSSGATERLRLWDKFCTSNIDPEAVKINFLRHSRISQYYPRKRIPRVKLNPKNTAKVIRLNHWFKIVMLKFCLFRSPRLSGITIKSLSL